MSVIRKGTTSRNVTSSMAVLAVLLGWNAGAAGAAPSGKPSIPSVLKRYVLSPKETPGYERRRLSSEVSNSPSGRRQALVQEYVKQWPRTEGLGGFGLSVFVIVCASRKTAVAVTRRWLKDEMRAVPPKWKKGAFTGAKLRADEVWTDPDWVRTGTYELVLRRGSLVIVIGLSGPPRALPKSEIALVEALARSLLARQKQK